MSLPEFLEKIKNNDPVDFQETIAVLTEHYDYHPAEFRNGLGEHCLVNSAGVNEGSCKIFAFALLHDLDKQQTLNLFGDFYRVDVLGDPEGNSHQNIRNFIKYGWEGIEFEEMPLEEK
ncbi:HopJ type III effector protein [Methylomicrobium lacus]|uniref:HopJ type III effector protein n=1 Tax=Methylomicrobium lacus TaxID=136992 RepID=UPI00045EA42C|nr:HopJ type III effector protein [Methylomicrobium lacus]